MKLFYEVMLKILLKVSRASSSLDSQLCEGKLNSSSVSISSCGLRN